MLIILGVAIMSLIALGFLASSFDPFEATRGVKALFLAAGFIALVSVSAMALYAIAIGWHEGLKYFVARYFGPDFPYFKSAFRRAFLLGVLAVALFGLKRFDVFARYFIGVSVGMFVIELLSSIHERHTHPKS